jgi:hypothetical protein
MCRTSAAMGCGRRTENVSSVVTVVNAYLRGARVGVPASRSVGLGRKRKRPKVAGATFSLSGLYEVVIDSSES